MIADYHVHPNYSTDADPEATIGHYCERAVQLGIQEICFTTHFDPNPYRRDKEMEGYVIVDGVPVPNTDFRWVEKYLKDIETAKKVYTSYGLRVKAGLETDYLEEVEDVIDRLLSGYPFDFVLGSIHNLDNICISGGPESDPYFIGRKPADVCDKYFRELRLLVEFGHVHCLAHIDLYRRFGLTRLGRELEVEGYSRAAEILRLAARKGIGIEINTSGLRQGLGTTMPEPEMLKLAKDMGIATITFGSDCHRVEDLGAGIQWGQELARQAGFITFATFAKGQAEYHPL